MKYYLNNWFLIICILISSILAAENNKSQIPLFIQQSTLDIGFGFIHYPFSAVQLEPGYKLHSLTLPQKGLQLSYRYLINHYLSAQLDYMMLLPSVKYTYSTLNNENETLAKPVLLNTGGLTLNPQLPIGKRWIFYTKGGVGIVSRRGIQDISGNTVLKEASYTSLMWGAGLSYQINKSIDLQINTTSIPENSKHHQPATTFFGAGVSYHPLAFTDSQLEKVKLKNRVHQKHLIQYGYTTNVAGYEINNRLEKMYLFWGGNAQIKKGVMLNYMNSVFRAPKVLALYWGAGVSYFESNLNHEKLLAISVFPVFRFNLLYTKPLDMYIFYSIAGPSYITSNKVDGIEIGKHIIFQDNMGVGVNFGKDRHYNAEIKIGHYSNGNLFPINHGVKIPLSFNLGYAF